MTYATVLADSIAKHQYNADCDDIDEYYRWKGAEGARALTALATTLATALQGGIGDSDALAIAQAASAWTWDRISDRLLALERAVWDAQKGGLGESDAAQIWAALGLDTEASLRARSAALEGVARLAQSMEDSGRGDELTPWDDAAGPLSNALHRQANRARAAERA